jgi:hypothetical protein
LDGEAVLLQHIDDGLATLFIKATSHTTEANVGKIL